MNSKLAKLIIFCLLSIYYLPIFNFYLSIVLNFKASSPHAPEAFF